MDDAPSQRLTDQLKTKSRRRRNSLARLTAAERASPQPRNDLLPVLELTRCRPAELIAPTRNVRSSEAARTREVAASISALGFCDPILVDAQRSVIDGVTTLEAAKLLGLPEVPCIVVSHLKPAELRLLRIALNRLQETGGWDLDALKIEFEELMVEDIPIEITGFSPPEIDLIMMEGEGETVDVGPLALAADIPSIASPGDVFTLGDHRLICGDATDPQIIKVLMEGNSARLGLTDPPYNVPIVGHVTKGDHREFAMATGEMDNEEFQRFNAAWMDGCLQHICEGGLLAVFSDWRAYPSVHAAAMSRRLEQLNLVVWTKTNAGMGSLYRSQHELLPIYKKGSEPHANNVELGRSGRWRSNVWTYPGASTIGSEARHGLKEHPTVKPVDLLADAMLDVTDKGDIVLDPFLGSGSTLIAAEKTGRRCCGIELDPSYVDVILRRFQNTTGKVPQLVGTA